VCVLAGLCSVLSRFGSFSVNAPNALSVLLSSSIFVIRFSGPKGFEVNITLLFYDMVLYVAPIK
jgi:hypothetical protein